jgi:hypothetical protein
MVAISTEKFDSLEDDIRALVNERPRTRLEELWGSFDCASSPSTPFLSPLLTPLADNGMCLPPLRSLPSSFSRHRQWPPLSRRD